jgi:hypothetical protein
LLTSSNFDIIVPSSIFFPSLAATLDVTQISPGPFLDRMTTILTVLRDLI